MTKDIIIEVPLIDQYRDTENKDWAPKTCGICAIKMLMAFYNEKLMDVGVMKLVGEAVESNGFMENVGWKHNALVSVAEKYGVQLDFKRNFSRTNKEREGDIKFVNRHILDGKPLIVSIFYGLDHSRGGHLVVINGIRKNGRKIDGYFIQDPDHLFRGNNYYITDKEFRSGWRGGMIYFK